MIYSNFWKIINLKKIGLKCKPLQIENYLYSNTENNNITQLFSTKSQSWKKQKTFDTPIHTVATRFRRTGLVNSIHTSRAKLKKHILKNKIHTRISEGNHSTRLVLCILRGRSSFLVQELFTCTAFRVSI